MQSTIWKQRLLHAHPMQRLMATSRIRAMRSSRLHTAGNREAARRPCEHREQALVRRSHSIDYAVLSPCPRLHLVYRCSCLDGSGCVRASNLRGTINAESCGWVASTYLRRRARTNVDQSLLSCVVRKRKRCSQARAYTLLGTAVARNEGSRPEHARGRCVVHERLAKFAERSRQPRHGPRDPRTSMGLRRRRSRVTV